MDKATQPCSCLGAEDILNSYTNRAWTDHCIDLTVCIATLTLKSPTRLLSLLCKVPLQRFRGASSRYVLHFTQWFIIYNWAGKWVPTAILTAPTFDLVCGSTVASLYRMNSHKAYNAPQTLIQYSFICNNKLPQHGLSLRPLFDAYKATLTEAHRATVREAFLATLKLLIWPLFNEAQKATLSEASIATLMDLNICK